MNIDPRSHVPIYLQLANGIREAIAAGIYRPGESLPSLRNMALEVQVNPNTVQRAYDELAREGTIYSQRGKGLFVSDQACTSAQNRARQSVCHDFRSGIRTGRAAGLTIDDIRGLFEATLAEGGASEGDT